MSDQVRQYVPARPVGRPAVVMRWENLLFIHWRVGVDVLRGLVPAGLEIDAFDGSGWVGLVPFTMPVIRHRFWPRRLNIAGLTRFHECNVRTYVTRNGEPGVWFFSLDAASRVGVRVARTFWNLNYCNAKIDLEQREDGQVHYCVERACGGPKDMNNSNGSGSLSLRCCWRVGEALPRSAPGSLEYFLTERYMLYAASRRGALFRGRIWHEPWPLRRATLASCEDMLVKAAGIEIPVSGEPVVFAADPLDVEAWPLERA
jgi:uncharacterized protein YqjF (DUF2071 family)